MRLIIARAEPHDLGDPFSGLALLADGDPGAGERELRQQAAPDGRRRRSSGSIPKGEGLVLDLYNHPDRPLDCYGGGPCHCVLDRPVL